MKKKPTVELSVIATVYNDCEIVPLLVNEIIKNIEPLKVEYEIILVNDSSEDKSDEFIRNECSKNPKIKGITLNRNFGQQIAMSAGIRHANGNYILIMDGDLQNPPEAIPELLYEIKKGFDIVYTVSKKRNNIIDSATSGLFWFVLIKVFRVVIIKDQLMLKIFSKGFVDKYNLYNEINRTVDGLAIDISANYNIIEVQNRKRVIGKSHYNFSRRFNLMIDMVINLTDSPINFMIHIGWITFASTVILSLIRIYMLIFEDITPGFTSLILSICFFGSLTVLLLGIIGRYLSNINIEVKNRPLYHIKKTYNL